MKNLKPFFVRYNASLILLLYFSFPAYAVYKLRITSVFNFFASDAFYYLSIAKKTPLLWNSTDGVTHTNGFHPLWQNLLNLVYRIFDPSDSMFIYVVFVISLLIVSVGFYFIAEACQRISYSKISLIFLFPGMVYLCGYQATTSEYGISNIYQPVSFINGMESSLTILFFGVLFLVLHKSEFSSPKDWAVVGGVISLITLSRLDDFFLLFGFILYLLIFHRQNKYRNLLALSAPVGCAIVTLFSYHLITGQTLMPVSGSIKGTNTGEFESNFTTLKKVLIPGDTLQAVTTRVYGILIPFLMAAIFLALFLTSQRIEKFRYLESSRQIQSLGKFLLPLCVYVVFKSIYTYFDFYLIETGYWYYVGPVICVNFLAAILIGVLLDKNIYSKIFLAGLIFLVQIFTFSNNYQKLQTPNSMSAVFANRGELQKKLDQLFGLNAKFIDGTDGIYSFIFRNPSQSARAFTANKEGYESFKIAGYDGYYQYLLASDYRVLVGLDSYTHPVPSSIKVTSKYRDEATGTVFSLLEEIP